MGAIDIPPKELARWLQGQKIASVDPGEQAIVIVLETGMTICIYWHGEGLGIWLD